MRFSLKSRYRGTLVTFPGETRDQSALEGGAQVAFDLFYKPLAGKPFDAVFGWAGKVAGPPDDPAQCGEVMPWIWRYSTQNPRRANGTVRC